MRKFGFTELVFVVFIIVICFTIINSIRNESTIEKVVVTVVDLQQQKIEKNGSTEMRYLIITDKETFICEDSYWNSKYNNSDIFYNLRKNKKYVFEVCGLGKSAFNDYRNVLTVVSVD